MRSSKTIAKFCADHGPMSRSMFYKLERQGRAPDTFNIGSTRRISDEAEERWLREREAEAAEVRGV
jgi:predicted DNA-binding transcriptional regulator AlpA